MESEGFQILVKDIWETRSSSWHSKTTFFMLKKELFFIRVLTESDSD